MRECRGEGTAEGGRRVAAPGGEEERRWQAAHGGQGWAGGGLGRFGRGCHRPSIRELPPLAAVGGAAKRAQLTESGCGAPKNGAVLDPALRWSAACTPPPSCNTQRLERASSREGRWIGASHLPKANVVAPDEDWAWKRRRH